MASGLGALVKNLERKKFVNLAKYCGGKKFDLLLRKGVFPYDYFDGPSRMEDTSLPPREDFYSKLNDEHISQEDYEHAKEVWKVFECKTLKRYDIYLKSDVLLLADVFESFRDICVEHYSLDPAWYYTSPGLAWDAMLRKTDVCLELLKDPDMRLLFEKGIRGGMSVITKGHGEANKPYMANYYPEKPSKYIMYLDANNLYGWAMSKPLPVRGFKWMTDDEQRNWRDHRCILEVDIEDLSHLHDAHNDYPLASERKKVGRVEKLVPNLGNKEKYVIHHQAFKAIL